MEGVVLCGEGDRGVGEGEGGCEVEGGGSGGSESEDLELVRDAGFHEAAATGDGIGGGGKGDEGVNGVVEGESRCRLHSGGCWPR